MQRRLIKQDCQQHICPAIASQASSVAMSYAARDTVPVKVCVNAQILWPALSSAVCCVELHLQDQFTSCPQTQAK